MPSQRWQRKVRVRMNEKTDVQVIINGKQYTICGYESSDYLQRIANHINEKYDEFKRQEAYNRLDMDMKNILLAINLSDDYFKAQKQADENRQQQGEVEQEMFRMKHEIVSRNEELKSVKEQLKQAQAKTSELEKKTIRLEAELDQKTQELLNKEKELEKKSQDIAQKEKELEQKSQDIVRKDKELESKTKEVEEKNKELLRRAAAQVARTEVPQQRQAYPAAANVVRPQQVQTGATSISQSSQPVKTVVPAAHPTASGTQSVSQAVAVTPKDDSIMSGIQPVAVDKTDNAKPAIASFEMEADPKEDGTQDSQNGARGRKNSGSRRSQSKRK